MSNSAQGALFDDAVQPWFGGQRSITPEDQQERDRLLAWLATGDLATVEAKVASLLAKFPETRDSDIALSIRYWQIYESDILIANKPPSLEVLFDLQPMTTIVRCRQRIQNDFQLFVGTRRTRAFRDDRQLQFYQYMAQQRDAEAELRVYIDETGSDTGSRFVGIGGVAVLDTRSYEYRHAAIREWRRTCGHPATFHYADMTSASERHYLEFLSQIQKHRAGLVFLGYATLHRGRKDLTITALIPQLISDLLAVAKDQGCLSAVRAVSVIKEASEGFDSLFREDIKQNLAELIADRFADRAYLKDFHCVPKGHEVFLEAADLIAASMRRRWESGGRIHKDRVADAVINVTGFEGASPEAALYRLFHSS